MTERKIKWIIGIMGIALAGVIYLQLHSIRRGIKLNTEQFDNNVFAALSNVARRLELNERKDVVIAINGYSAEEIEKDADENFSLVDLMKNVISDPEGVKKNIGEALDAFSKEMDKVSVEQRVPVDKLESFFQKEMKNHGIKLDYTYGVYSKEKTEFVIYDGHYLIDGSNQRIQKRFLELEKSPYSVYLFAQDKISPGKLFVMFPEKRNYILSTLMPFSIAAILFTGIIMFIFSYTIFVILRQKKVSEMKTDFMNNMTHEFKTPIATISLAADSITNSSIINNPDKIKRFANIIKQENKRMHKQVEQVLNSARWEKKEVQINLEPVDLHQIIARAVENISLQVEKKGGEIKMTLDAKNTLLRLDKTHISNIIHNLLDNANKYTPKNPKISVITRNVNRGIEVVIGDNGIGIGREGKKHIFEKFYRVHTGNRHDVKGFGLGLAYVKTIIELHGGRVSVESELGKGSDFILFFPKK